MSLPCQEWHKLGKVQRRILVAASVLVSLAYVAAATIGLAALAGVTVNASTTRRLKSRKPAGNPRFDQRRFSKPHIGHPPFGSASITTVAERLPN